VPADRLADVAPGSPGSARWPADPARAVSLYTYYAVPSPGSRPAAIEVRQSLEPEHVFLRQTILRGALTTSVMVVVCGLVAMIVGNVFVGRPVRRLVDQARRIGQGDLSTRLDVTHRDELGSLAVEMNTMSDRLSETRARLESETSARIAALEQLRHADRLTTIGKLAAGLAHELGTPLNVVKGYAQLLVDEHPVDSSSQEFARIIYGQAERLATIVRQLLDFGRQRSPCPSRQDIGHLARETTELLASLAHRNGASLEVHAPPTDIWVHVDAGQIKQALTNLLVNAVQSMPQGGPVTVQVDRRRAEPPAGHAGKPGDFACVSVRDRGIGIAEDDLSRVFEPFFTTKAVGEGTGLGLSVTYGIIREHGGWIDVKSEPGQGSCFSIFVPVEEELS
jgi:signal transduction histidine kinase